MPYDPFRIQRQRDEIFRLNGQTVYIRRQINSTAGANIYAGLPATPVTQDRAAVAIVGKGQARIDETNQPGGLIAQDEITMTTREKVLRGDSILWQGSLYRVESDPTPSPIDNAWQFTVKRATP